MVLCYTMIVLKLYCSASPGERGGKPPQQVHHAQGFCLDVEVGNDGVEKSIFDGEYPTNISDEYLDTLEKARSMANL